MTGRCWLAECPGLAEYLARVPDPRDRRGVRHTLTSLLLAAVAAVLAGARSFTAVGEWVADAPPQVLTALGVRRDPLAGRFEPPDEATIRRVLEAVDAAALDAAVGSWLPARLRAAGQEREHGRRSGGRWPWTARRCGAPGTPAVTGRLCTCWLPSTSRPVRARPGQRGWQDERDHRSSPAAGAPGPGRMRHHRRCDAYPARARRVPGHEKKAHYILVVKKNQPGLYAQVKNLPWRNIPPVAPQRDRGHGREEHRTCRSRPSRRGSRSRTPPRPSASPAASGPERREEMAHRHRLRDHQPGRRARLHPPSSPQWIRGHWQIEAAAPHPRRQLRRRRLPDPHWQRPPGHGCPAQPRHRDPENGRARQIARPAPPRPRRHPDPGNPRTQPAMTETDITTAPRARWPSSFTSTTRNSPEARASPSPDPARRLPPQHRPRPHTLPVIPQLEMFSSRLRRRRLGRKPAEPLAAGCARRCPRCSDARTCPRTLPDGCRDRDGAHHWHHVRG